MNNKNYIAPELELIKISDNIMNTSDDVEPGGEHLLDGGNGATTDIFDWDNFFIPSV